MAARLQEARAAVAAADAEVRTVETKIERRTVRAPIAGEVLQVELRAGECALADHNAAPLIMLGAVHPLHLRVDVNSTRHRASFRRRVVGDAQIVAPARLGDCAVLLSKHTQHGLDVNGTRILKPFMPDAPSPGRST